MTTGQIIDFAIGKVNDKALPANQTSYQYKRISAMGNVDTVQLNMTDNTLSNLDYQTQLDRLNKMKNTATEPSAYMHTGRIISSITNETLPLKQNFQYNHQDETYIQREEDSCEREADDVSQENNMTSNNINLDASIPDIIDIRGNIATYGTSGLLNRKNFLEYLQLPTYWNIKLHLNTASNS